MRRTKRTAISTDQRQQLIDTKKEVESVILSEIRALEKVLSKIDGSYQKAIDALLALKGRVLVSGIGKSGIIAKKIAATLTSTGTPASFIHPLDSMHGDIGIVSSKDVAIILSNSGKSDELLTLIMLFKRFGTPVILITSKKTVDLAKYSNITIAYGSVKEACPFNMVPTSSAIASLAVGDALAVALFKCKGFKKEDYALIHPGGSLGARMFLTVKDLMHTGKDHPQININATLKDAIVEMTSKKNLGMTCVVDNNNNIMGVITDGDLRRILEVGDDKLLQRPLSTILKKNIEPKTIGPELLAVEALAMMRKHSITSIVVVKGLKKPIGTIHIHDLLKAGLA